MRFIIETQNEGRILLEPEKMGEMGSLQQVSQAAAIDGGAPSEALMNAIAGSTPGMEGEAMEEGGELTSMEETSSFH
jgi:hypothetical protein